MATINFLYRSTREKAPLTLRLLYRLNEKDFVFAVKTKCEVEKDYWKKHNSNTKDAQLKNKQLKLKAELQKIENHILDAFKVEYFENISKEWLKEQIDAYYNPNTIKHRSELVTDVIQDLVDNAHLRDNGKGGVGLSDCRVNAYKLLKRLFLDFQGKKKYKVSQLDKNEFEGFKRWLLEDKKYSVTTAFKKLSDLKTVCKEARSRGIETSTELNDIKTRQVSAYDDDMDVITLTDQELNQIESLKITREALINARKWLLLACYTGQRGEALTKRVNESNFEKYGEDLIIKIVQKKGNKPVIIPVLPKVKEIYDSGLPYSISTQKLNQYFKEIGKMAGVNAPTLGRKQDKTRRGVKKVRPKYEYISTHIGRRTFATNHYGKIPTPIIMRVTGHSKESTFLTYINQSDDSHIDTFLDFYKTKELKERKEPQLNVVKKASNE